MIFKQEKEKLFSRDTSTNFIPYKFNLFIKKPKTKVIIDHVPSDSITPLLINSSLNFKLNVQV